MDRETLRKEEQEIAARDKADEDLEHAGEKEREQENAAIYGAVVDVMAEILSPAPGFDPPDFLPPDIAEALASLYAAKTAVHEEIGDGHVSAIERMQLLNLSLAQLRPVLSLGMELGVKDELRTELGEKVGELRHVIRQTIYKEAVGRKKRKKKVEDNAPDENDPTNKDDDADSDETADEPIWSPPEVEGPEKG